MKFYKRWLGDYAKDTAGLTLLEHGAYNVMLDLYYSTEEPLPSDNDSLYRMTRAMTEPEQKVIHTVLEQLWEKTPDGWVNKRAVKEIDRYGRYTEDQRAKAAKRWSGDSKPKPKPEKTARKELTDGIYTFSDFKALYPPRSGSQPWARAERAARARMKKGDTLTSMVEGAERYARYCAAVGNLDTQYVMQAGTFLGPDRHFAEPWHIPPDRKETGGKPDMVDDVLAQVSRNRGAGA